jgi:hypothetical protein
MRNKDTILLERAYLQTKRVISEDSKEESLKALHDAISNHAKNPNDDSAKKSLDDAMTAYYKVVSDGNTNSSVASAEGDTANSKAADDKDGWQLDSTEKQVIHDPNAQTIATGATSEIENSSAKDENGNELSYQRTQTPYAAGDEAFKNYKSTAVRPTEVGEEPADKNAAAASARERLKKERAKDVYNQASGLR